MNPIGRISALNGEILALFRGICVIHAQSNQLDRQALRSPKAEVRGSNPFGRASKINYVVKVPKKPFGIISALPVLMMSPFPEITHER